jgi:wyosine [tRNA(Phe)-imidazoG37] synthetase (radical SAM superfamily)
VITKTTFGPVASRRFGLSLGIDLSPNEKSCNFDCVYCELAKSPKKDTIKNPPSVENIINDIRQSLKKHSNIEVLTITANGEPTLYPYLKDLIKKIKEEFKHKLLILSNSSNIYKKEIQEILNSFDIVKLSLDSVLGKSFVKIDRPIHRDLKQITDGIIEFSKQYKNELVIEILVVKNINDTEEDFKELNKILNKINPTRVDIGTIERPPAYDVAGVEYSILEKLSNFIINQNINIVTRKPTNNQSTYNEDEILKIIKKRPLCQDEIESIFNKKTIILLNKMVENRAIETVEIDNKLFYNLNRKIL